MAEEGGGGGEEMVPLVSPKNKVKFLCSHGGKILPRPADGHLKYVGGETRVVAVSRDINFSELMEKLTALFDGDVVLKYQLIPDELDALVSVRSDEDLRHMLDEYDRQESEGTPRLRAFLFPANPIVVENQTTLMDPHALEQRYIDAINGIIRSTTIAKLSSGINANRPHLTISTCCSSPKRHPSISSPCSSPKPVTFSVSSACSSPKTTSPEKHHSIESMNQEGMLWNIGYHQNNGRLHPMHKVQSSPSLCSLTDNQQHHKNNYHQSNYHHYHQNHQNQQLQQQQHHHQQSHGYSLSARPPQDPHRSGGGSERLVSALSFGRIDTGRSQLGYGPSDHYYSTTSSRHHNRGCGGCNKYGHSDEYSPYGVKMGDRAESLPRSPRKSPWE